MAICPHCGMGNGRKMTEIYDRILEIRAKKGSRSMYSGELFYHPFTSKAAIYGLPNGGILIIGNQPLWGLIEQEEE
jgi:hypothetical protein